MKISWQINRSAINYPHIHKCLTKLVLTKKSLFIRVISITRWYRSAAINKPTNLTFSLIVWYKVIFQIRCCKEDLCLSIFFFHCCLVLYIVNREEKTRHWNTAIVRLRRLVLLLTLNPYITEIPNTHMNCSNEKIKVIILNEYWI